MIDLKEAIAIAKNFIIEMDGEKDDFHLESAVLSLDKESWQVTYSYKRKLENLNDLQKILGVKERKFYKKVIIDSKDKKIIGYFDNAYDKSEAA